MYLNPTDRARGGGWPPPETHMCIDVYFTPAPHISCIKLFSFGKRGLTEHIRDVSSKMDDLKVSVDWLFKEMETAEKPPNLWFAVNKIVLWRFWLEIPVEDNDLFTSSMWTAGNLQLRYPGIRGRRKWRPKEEMGERERERESVLKSVAFVCKMI